MEARKVPKVPSERFRRMEYGTEVYWEPARQYSFRSGVRKLRRYLAAGGIFLPRWMF